MNQKKVKNDVELRAKDLVVYVLQCWRALILWLVIGAIVLAGYSFIQYGFGTVATGRNVHEVLSETQIDRVQSVASSVTESNAMMAEINDYLQHAIYLQLDPFNLYTRKMTFSVDNFKEDVENNYELESIAMSYVTMIRNDNVDQAMQEIYGDEYYRYNELLLLDSSMTDTGTFSLTIYALDYDMAEALGDIVIEDMEDSHDSIAAATSAHSLTQSADSYYIFKDSSIYDVQNYTLSRPTYITSQIKSLKDSVTATNEVSYLNYLLANPGDVDGCIITTAGSKSQLGKYAVIGAVLGLIIAIIVIIIKYVLTALLRNANDVNDMFGTQLLGVSKAKRKKHNTGLDRKIRKLRSANQLGLSDEELLKIIAAKIELEINSKSLKNVIVAIGAFVEVDEETLNKAIGMVKSDCRISVVGNIQAQPESILDLSEVDGAILVEQIDKSKNNNILAEHQLCKRYDVDVIGAIVLE